MSIFEGLHARQLTLISTWASFMPIFSRFFLLGLCFCAHQGVAQSNFNPNPHTHGLAIVNIIYESGKLLIELETPAANMLDVEHRPTNTHQLQQLSELRKTLTTPNNIIGLLPNCSLQRVKVELPFKEIAETTNLSGQSSSEEPTHHHCVGDPHKGDNDNESRYNRSADDVHQDIHVSYEWGCTGSVPPTILLHVFSLYPRFEQIQAQWVTDGKQGAKTLNKNHTALEIES